jgi:hypothetical protein
MDGWKRISLREFPEQFKINLIVTGLKKDEPKILQAARKLGLVPAEIVEDINSEPGRSRETYTILHAPLDYGPPQPEYSGPKAPHPIAPLNTTGGNK